MDALSFIVPKNWRYMFQVCLVLFLNLNNWLLKYSLSAVFVSLRRKQYVVYGGGGGGGGGGGRGGGGVPTSLAICKI